MTIPTIVAVTPDAGSTRGRNIVKITGTGFRGVTPPTTGSRVWSHEPQTVQVLFGTAVSPFVGVVSATELDVEVPEWRGSLSVTFPVSLSVTIKNLDDAGIPIPTETATKTTAYAVSRPKLTTRTPYLRICVELIEALRRHVHENVWWTMSPDFDDNTADGLDETKRGKLPLLKLSGPSETDNPTIRPDFGDVTETSTTYERKRNRQFVDLDFGLEGICRGDQNVNELTALSNAVTDFFQDRPWLSVLKDPAVPTSEMLEYPVSLTSYPDLDVGPDLDGLQRFRCAVTIEGVPRGEEYQPVVERGGVTYADAVPDVDPVAL